MSSPLDELATAIAARWRALPALVALEVKVRRGVPVGGITAGRWAIVEFDGRPDSNDNSRFTREWLDMACTRQRELGEIICTAVAQTGGSGEDSVEEMEADALAVLDACVADLRSDLTVGGVVWSQQVTTGSSQLLQNTAGVAVVVPFTVAYAAQV